MDWNAAIERNRDALKRILAMLVTMAGIAVGPRPEARAGGEPRRTLPRHLHRAIVSLLRPAEAAARRLIIVVARDLVVAPPRPAKPKPALANAALRRLGIAVVTSPADRAAAAPQSRAVRPRTLSLPLLDPLPRPARRARKTVSDRSMPRIWTLGMADPKPVPPLPPSPSPDDPVDATRLGLRLAALASALNDLPGQAMRFARWKARRDSARPAGRLRRLSPLRPGPAYGARRPGSRRRVHEVDEVLADMHHFAFLALQRRDTS